MSQPGVLGKGGFGCTYRPPLRCAGNYPDSFYDGKVTKLMTERHAEEEIDEYEAIDEADPQMKFHLGNPVMCDLNGNYDTLVKETCENDFLKEDNYEDLQLLVLPDGGLDTYQFYRGGHAEEYFLRHGVAGVRHFLAAFVEVSKGLEVMKKAELCHHDLKPSNVVCKISEDGSVQLRMIDFGSMETMGSIAALATQNRNPFAIYHWNFPLTCKFLERKEWDKIIKAIKSSSTEEFKQSIVKDDEARHATQSMIDDCFPDDADNDALVTKILNKFADYLINFHKRYLATNMDDRSIWRDYFSNAIRRIDVFGLGVTFLFCTQRMKKYFDQEAAFDGILTVMEDMISYNTPVSGYTNRLQQEVDKFNATADNLQVNFVRKEDDTNPNPVEASGGSVTPFDPYADPVDAQGNPLRWWKQSGGAMGTKRRRGIRRTRRRTTKRKKTTKQRTRKTGRKHARKQRIG